MSSPDLPDTPSILRRLLLSYLAFGLGVALIFPFYANIFVNWKDGMLPWFVAGCVVAGLSLGVANYVLLNFILLRKLRRIADVANQVSRKDLTQHCAMQSADTTGEISATISEIHRNIGTTVTSIANGSQQAADTLHGRIAQFRLA